MNYIHGGMNSKIPPATPDTLLIHWTEDSQSRSARWHSEGGAPVPRRVQLADDTMSADTAFRLASEGTALLWRGDFQNARQLLQALARRMDRKPRKGGQGAKPMPLSDAFHRHRMAQAQRARTLGMVVMQIDSDYRIDLRRAPDVAQACIGAYGPGTTPFVASLRELLGLIGAHEWRSKGVDVPALGARIHPHYGVFAPVRGEYVDLVAQAPLPAALAKDGVAFDVGTGTGVLAAVLARRGVAHIVATDQSPRALECARDNIARLAMGGQVDVVQADLFPPGLAALAVCNPPWLPGRAGTALEQAVYDPDSRMLLGFVAALAQHLAPGGEGWLILSDLAEHLGLRTRAELLAAFESAGLKVAGRIDARPTHPRASDTSDALHAARSAEVTSLWRLQAGATGG